jgi:dihydrofolate reductase
LSKSTYHKVHLVPLPGSIQLIHLSHRKFVIASQMRKIILEEWISLDGYISDRNGKLDFFTDIIPQAYSDAHRIQFLETIDTILFGRATYEQFARTWPDRPTDSNVLAAKINGTKKIVFSNTLSDAPWGKWPKAEILAGDVISNIKRFKSLPGKSMVLWGSISLAQMFMKESLIDEYHLHLCPALTTGGRHLFTEEINPTTLKLLEARHYGRDAVFLNYQASLVSET